MMMVKLEAREFSLQQTVDELEKAKAALEQRLTSDRETPGT
jgi:hypothetical protein